VQGGFDLIGLLNRVAVIGIALSFLVLLRGHAEKASLGYLALSTVWKLFWLVFVFFVLGLGYPETLGLAILGGKAGPSENIVVFDFRLFAVLATVIVVLMIARSILQYQEAKLKVITEEAPIDKTSVKQ
jgi:multisubunit Na+/H+ antiporter MnhB subunit